MAKLNLFHIVIGIAVLVGLYMLYGKRVQGFEPQYTLYGAKKGKAPGEACQFDAECASDICRHYTSQEGPVFTCH
jgi:hypothetical protein